MSINNLRKRPIPPHPKGWGLLGQQVEGNMSVGGFHTTGFRYYSIVMSLVFSLTTKKV